MEFIIGLRKHKFFSYTVSAYWAERGDKDKNFYILKQNILPQDVLANLHQFTSDQAEIVKLIDGLSDHSIYRKFLKVRNLSMTEFYNNIDQKYVDEYILPYAGRIINKILKIAHRQNIKIFLKPFRYDEVFMDDQLFYIFDDVEPVFNFKLNGNELRYNLKVFHRGIALDMKGKDVVFLSNRPCIFLLDNHIYHSDNFNCKKVLPFLKKDYITVSSNIEKYLESFVKGLIADYKVNATGFEIKEIFPSKKPVLTLERFIGQKWGLNLSFRYGNIQFSPANKKRVYVTLEKENGKYVFYRLSRDMSWEENIVFAFKQSGLRPCSSPNFFIVPSVETGPDEQLINTISWLNEHSDILKDLGIEVIQNTDREYYTEKLELNLKVEKKIDWFDIYAMVRFGDIEIPFLSLRENILQGKREIELPNGQIAIIPDEWFSRYKNIMLFAKKDRDKYRIKLSKTHFTLLQELEHPAIKYSVHKLIDNFRNKQWRIPSVPNTVRASLRNYQRMGYAWICQLCKHDFGGCLADDMGLGKTIQTITAIAKATEEEGKKSHNIQVSRLKGQQSLFSTNGKGLTSLIVVPKSLIHNWINEFKRFAPSFSIINYTGTNRFKLRDKLLSHDIVLTSYGIMRNDIEFFSSITFFYIVLDESQYIKNPHSKVFHAVRSLKGRHRLILTGTPIENSLSDLWTQMTFVNPGLLGSYNFFKRNFITPIEKNSSYKAKQELKRIISPFILRRTKQEVVKDLPHLIEQTVFCEMTEDQALIYEAEKSKVRNEVLRVYEQGRLKESSIYILRALMRLRQIANHPRILDNQKHLTSGKFDTVVDKINTVLQEGHKLLLFSSFVKHLDIYKEYFEQEHLPYVMLTGESENRQEIIKQFQENDKVNLFLISLKAGGVGLNLTSADYVFILDPWWNPAAEEQAIARAHRIGQDRPVIVYRFISVGTVEEKIRILQEKKRELFTEFVEASNIFSQLSEDNLISLFS